MTVTNNPTATTPFKEIHQVVNYLWEDEWQSFKDAPSCGHVFASLFAIGNWLTALADNPERRRAPESYTPDALPLRHFEKVLDYVWEKALVDHVRSGSPKEHVYWSVSLVAHWVNTVRPDAGNPNDPRERDGWRTTRVYRVPKGFSFL